MIFIEEITVRIKSLKNSAKRTKYLLIVVFTYDCAPFVFKASDLRSSQLFYSLPSYALVNYNRARLQLHNHKRN